MPVNPIYFPPGPEFSGVEIDEDSDMDSVDFWELFGLPALITPPWIKSWRKSGRFSAAAGRPRVRTPIKVRDQFRLAP